MSISVLGKSLLASAKKKSKKNEKIGYGLLGLMGVNKIIREKAIKRAEQFNNSLIPIKKRLTGEFTTIGNTKAEYEKRENHAEGALGSFIEEERESILKIAAKSPSSVSLNPEQLNQLAKENVEKKGTYNTYQEKVNIYKPYFDVDKDEFFLQFNKLEKGSEEIKSDNILNVMGRGFGLTEKGKLITTKVKLSNAEEIELTLPEQLYNTLDIPFLQELGKIEERKVKIEDIKSKEIDSLYTENGEVTATLNRITNVKDRQVSNPKINKSVEDSWSYITSSTYDDPKTLEKDMVDNPFYIGTLTFIGKDNNGNDIKSNITVEQLEEQLNKTFQGEKIGSFARQQITDWDVFVRDSKVIAQSKFYTYSNDKNNVPPTEQDFNQWMSEAVMENAKQIKLEATSKGLFGLRKGADKATLQFVKVEDDEGTGQVDNTKTFNNFKKFLDNKEDTKNENVQNDIKDFITKYPEFKKELQSYLSIDNSSTTTTTVNTADEIDEDLETPIETTPSLLSPSGRLSAEEMNRRMDEGAEKMGQEAFRLISVPGKIKKANKESLIKRAKKYVNQESSFFSSNTFNRWLKENKGITSTLKLDKEEKRELVQEFLDTLE